MPRLLDEPWAGARIAAGSFVFCELTGLTPAVDSIAASSNGQVTKATEVVTRAFRGLFAAAHSHGGDVLSFGGSSLCVLFTGDGRQGRAINAVHAMHDALNGEVHISAGIASGMVHLVTSGDDPRHLISIGPTVTRAIELAKLAGLGGTRAERVDHSGIATQGKPVAWPAADFLASSIQAVIESDHEEPSSGAAAIGYAIFSGVDQALQRNPGRATKQVDAVVDVVQRAAAAFDITILGNDVAPGGGTLLLTAGVPTAADDGEERMFQAAKAALQAEPPLALRFGVATGPVIAGSVGGPKRRIYAVIGETVELAARLAASASPGEVLTTHRAIDRATTRYAISEWEPVTFSGIDAQVVPVTVGHELASDQGGGGFVGRSEERASLTRAIAALGEGKGGVLDIVGAAGIGKSRLVTETLRDCGHKTVVVRCDEYQQSNPYFVASQLLRAVMGIGEEDDPERVGVLLRALVRELTPYLEPWMPLLAAVVGGQVKMTKAVRELSDPCRQQRTSAAVSQLISWLIQEPLVVSIEDAHWMDGSSADLLSFVLGGADLPCLVITTRRPSASGWAATADVDIATDIELGPLAPGAARALLTELQRDDPLPPDVLPALIDRSEGNPMFMELLALSEDPADHPPDDIEAAVLAQLNRLAPDDRTALEQASVFGRRIAPDQAEGLFVGVDWAALGDFIEPASAGRLRFRHGSVHDAVYASLAARPRQALHRTVAEALAESEPDSARVAIHFHHAGEHREAWKRCRQAGTRAFEQGAFDEAAALLELALESATNLEKVTKKDLAATAELLGDASMRAGRLEDAEEAFVVSLDLVRAYRDKARLVAKRAAVREREGKYPAALRLLTTAIKSLPKNSGPGDHAPFEFQYARVRLRQSRYRDAIERGERAVALAAKAGDEDTLGRAYYLSARARSGLEPGAGSDDVEKALEIFEQRGDHLMQAKALNQLGIDAYRCGRFDDALDYHDRNAKQREAAGDVIGAAMASYHAAVVLLDQGKLDDAVVSLERVRAASRAANSAEGIARSNMRLAEIDARRGNTALALGRLEETQAQFEDLGADREALENRLGQAEAHLLGGDVEEALATVDKALEASDAVADTATATLGLKRVRGVALVWMGKSQDGHIQLMEALEASQAAPALFEEALISDALATLYGDGEAADRRDEITEQLGIVQLPPFLTVS